MAQRLGGLLYKCEGPSSDLQHPHKSRCVFVTPVLVTVGTGRFLELVGQPA